MAVISNIRHNILGGNTDNRLYQTYHIGNIDIAYRIYIEFSFMINARINGVGVQQYETYHIGNIDIDSELHQTYHVGNTDTPYTI